MGLITTLKKAAQKLIGKQETSSGIISSSGIITHTTYDTTDPAILLQDYWKMYYTSSIPTTLIDIMILPLLQANWYIRSEKQTSRSKKAIEYIEWTLNNLYDGINHYGKHQMFSLIYGTQIFERVLVIDEWEGKQVNRLLRLFPIQLETVNRWYLNENSDWEGIEHLYYKPDQSYTLKNVYSPKIFNNVHNQDYQNPLGNSELRATRVDWIRSEELIESMVMAAQRGVGIPVISHDNTIQNGSIEHQASINAAVTIGNSPYTYYIEPHYAKLRFEALKEQRDNMPLLRFLESRMFYGGLVEFLKSGIGENGSRAATQEHKQPYISKIESIRVEMDEATNKNVIDFILLNSPYSDLLEKKDEKPYYETESLKKDDLSKVAQDIERLAKIKAITIDSDFEKWIRDAFELPSMTIQQIEKIRKNNEVKEIKNEEINENEEIEVDINELEFESSFKINNEQVNALSVFDLSNAEIQFAMSEMAARDTIQKWYKKFLDDFSIQLEKNRFKKLVIDKSMMSMFETELEKVYLNVYKEGSKNVDQEISKVKKKNSRSNFILDYEFQNKKGFKSSLEKLFQSAKNLIAKLKQTLETEMLRITTQFIDAVGGITAYIQTNFIDALKKDKSQLESNTSGGYTQGRLDRLDERKNEIELYLYDARLDKNTCSVCFAENGAVMTLEQIEATPNLVAPGGNTTPINLSCLGQDRCRCQWVIFTGK